MFVYPCVYSVAKRRGIISHLLGLSMSKAGMDTIFTVSTGQVTSYGPQGQFNWQVSYHLDLSMSTCKCLTIAIAVKPVYEDYSRETRKGFFMYRFLQYKFQWETICQGNNKCCLYRRVFLIYRFSLKQVRLYLQSHCLIYFQTISKSSHFWRLRVFNI